MAACSRCSAWATARVDAALLGQAIPFATPGEDSVWGGYGGLGLAWRVGPSSSSRALRCSIHARRCSCISPAARSACSASAATPSTPCCWGRRFPFATPGKDDVRGGFGGLGMEFRHASVAVFGSAEYLALNGDSSVVSGKAGVRVAF
jgi:hypothetical protein